MHTIDIDFDVFKELTFRRKSESMTENDVIRDLLKLSKSENISTKPDKSYGTPWVSKGVSFPHGTEFRASYKGQEHYGKVHQGSLIVNNEKFSSPSSAASSITGNSVNGWIFWECLLPNTGKWQPINSLKK
jgi:hypothetical protein